MPGALLLKGGDDQHGIRDVLKDSALVEALGWVVVRSLALGVELNEAIREIFDALWQALCARQICAGILGDPVVERAIHLRPSWVPARSLASSNQQIGAAFR